VIQTRSSEIQRYCFRLDLVLDINFPLSSQSATNDQILNTGPLRATSSFYGLHERLFQTKAAISCLETFLMPHFLRQFFNYHRLTSWYSLPRTLSYSVGQETNAFIVWNPKVLHLDHETQPLYPFMIKLHSVHNSTVFP
jgi:hypothetical protein